MIGVKRRERTAHDPKNTIASYGMGSVAAIGTSSIIFIVDLTADKSRTEISLKHLNVCDASITGCGPSQYSNDTDIVCCTGTTVSNQAVLQGFFFNSEVSMLS